MNAERPSITCYNFFNDLFFCSSHVHSFSLIGEGSRHTNFELYIPYQDGLFKVQTWFDGIMVVNVGHCLGSREGFSGTSPSPFVLKVLGLERRCAVQKLIHATVERAPELVRRVCSAFAEKYDTL